MASVLQHLKRFIRVGFSKLLLMCLKHLALQHFILGGCGGVIQRLKQFHSEAVKSDLLPQGERLLIWVDLGIQMGTCLTCRTDKPIVRRSRGDSELSNETVKMQLSLMQTVLDLSR